jgi:hypothetical protein
MALVTLSRTQIDALADLRFRSHSKVTMHYNTRRSLRKLGLVTWRPLDGLDIAQGLKPSLELTPAGRTVINVIGDLIEGVAPLGKDELGNQIRTLVIGDTTFALEV